MMKQTVGWGSQLGKVLYIGAEGFFHQFPRDNVPFKGRRRVESVDPLIDFSDPDPKTLQGSFAFYFINFRPAILLLPITIDAKDPLECGQVSRVCQRPLDVLLE